MNMSAVRCSRHVVRTLPDYMALMTSIEKESSSAVSSCHTAAVRLFCQCCSAIKNMHHSEIVLVFLEPGRFNGVMHF